MYTHPRQLVNAVCGGSELLMWDIDKMITSVDFEVIFILFLICERGLTFLHAIRKEITTGSAKEQYSKIYMYLMSNF